MKQYVKKYLQMIGIIFVVCLVILFSYLAYVIISYDRIEDNLSIDVQNTAKALTEGISTNKEYSIVSFNIGFGAYSNNFSFFMDGGKYSRALNKESVYANIDGAINTIKTMSMDFIFMQEVDTKSTRSYHVNQKDIILNQFSDSSSTYAINYDSSYLFYPILKPHGKSLSGILTMSNYKIESAIRRSLPISTSIYKFLDLDRCYTISKVAVDNGKYLCLYNVHLSAYTKDEYIVRNQIAMLIEDMKKDYEDGNYVVCGGDFNQDLLGNSPEIFGTNMSTENWAKPFPKEMLPEEILLVPQMINKDEIKQLAPSCRNAVSAYQKGFSFVTLVDGFLISDNVRLVEFTTIDAEFLYSDHNPVVLRFELK